MPFEELLPTILKVLGCAVAMYIVAGFVVSLSRLLPFLAILASVGTMFATSFALESGDPTMIWIPIATSILMQLFYKGTDFMDPRFDSNLYRLVNVERKWNSIFADFDDYELHFTPVSTGGFIENVVLNGLFFGLYYSFIPIYFPNTWVVHIFALYILLMSVIDVLGVFGILRINEVFYGLLRIFVIIAAVSIGFLCPFTDSDAGRREDVFTQCDRAASFNYDVSYYAKYEILYHGNYQTSVYDGTYFVYDASLGAAALYETVGDRTIYQTIYAKDSRLGDAVYEFSNINQSGSSYEYIKQAKKIDSPFKYIPMPSDSDFDFEAAAEFTKEKYDHLGDKVSWYDDEGTMSITYNTAYDSTYVHEGNPEFSVTWCFLIDKERSIVGLGYIQCTYRPNKTNSYVYTYDPISSQNTNFSNQFGEDGNLIGYAYESGDENEQFSFDLEETINSLNGTSGSIKDYDLSVKASVEEGSMLYTDDMYYLYDAKTHASAVYYNDDSAAESARDSNNFALFRPGCIVDNNAALLYDADYNIIASTTNLKYFTYDEADISSVILNLFSGEFEPKKMEYVESADQSLVKVLITEKNDMTNRDIEYIFNLVRIDGSYRLININAKLYHKSRNYDIMVYISSDVLDILLPASSNP